MAKYEDALRQLIPLKLGGDFDAAIEAEGAMLDELQALVEQFMYEIHPDTATETLEDWERLFGITTDETEPDEKRQARVVAKKIDVGGLNKDYYIEVANKYGHTIEIENHFPFVAGHGRAGEPVASTDIQWQVTIKGLSQSGYAFRAGASRAGERLGYNSEALDVVLDELKPAHDKFVYEYSY